MTTKTKTKKLNKLPRRRTATSDPILPGAEDVSAMGKLVRQAEESGDTDSIVQRLRRDLGLGPNPKSPSKATADDFSKVVTLGLLGPDAGVVLNHALIDDPGVLSRIVEHYGDITDVTNQTRVVCEIARAMHGYEKVADFCKSLLHEQKFVDLYIERPEIAKALKKASKVDVASDPKLGEELANKFLSSRADLVGSNPETPILPLPRNVHELKEGKQVVVGNDGSVTLDGERFTWLEHVSARLQSHGGVRWFYEEYGELLNSDWVKTMQADGDLFATGAASAIAWPFAVAGEKLAALSVVIQDRSGKLIRFVGRGLLTVVLTTTVIAKGTRWLVQQAAEWIAIMGRKAYNKLVGYAAAVWQWLSTPFVMALGAGGLPSVLATAGFVVLTGVLAGLCPVVGGSLAMTLGAPVLAGEIAGTVAGAGIIGTGAYTFVEAKELGRQLRCG